MECGGSTVLVGVKDLALDASAVRAGAREAAAVGGRLDLVHAYVWPLFPSADGEEGERSEDLVESAAAYARTVEPGLVVSARVVDGAPIPVLVRDASRAALVVLGGYGLVVPGVDPAASVSIQVAARASAPVMFVRDEERAGPVVVGMDGSPDAAAALRLAVLAARRRRTGVVVLHAAGARCASEGDAARLAAHQVVDGPADEALIRASRIASLLVVGAQGNRPTLLGPVTQAVLRHAASPVLVARHTAVTVQPRGRREEQGLAA
ncbi:universal stress protein [Phytohabitans suffuscus]|uniref:UspA domain-containing protein n=1 Tax=Phytohabitans suffuscus TaxID=624315 RepID=A0A6F8YTV5_9ACTN|nr:universal stress protein [Phytohabitans suffuscus]BCB89413.1 hypothetical protein Psuf_067260 [Phytohabitans suffuscus]